MCLKKYFNAREIGFGMSSNEITASAALAAISAALQMMHVGYLSPWGMWIDLVAVSWILGYFIYGGRTAFAVSIVGALLITLIAPSTWLGAIMKWIATVPMFLVPVALQKMRGIGIDKLAKLRFLVPVILLAVVIRGAIVIPVNYYIAIPIWMGWTPAQAMVYVPWWAIFGINAIQGALEVLLAWLLVFRFRLDRFRTW
ncbi:MAG: hypothetical protein JXC85_01770 [Candidatus Aenigmarchaeota archaeon]|nr:hypothetical protein [Candidatus Aenigmarchaeota archaeon]